ncbi:hypothetical protein TRFO_12588 [Tritrichomonas foetus]|uniref:Uncharacterized protein n=1 Tax=Tritrichomonas foetus TaxID=1144522 RepID=A0A1J4L1C6_9EUKA|nr:hypothetical protein TRFO_12588 [Tritrichomonas foetus]|eukprot:OHT17243.1 hypothetical protein TRFO_12588 [Tritrichomonas foetus]
MYGIYKVDNPDCGPRALRFSALIDEEFIKINHHDREINYIELDEVDNFLSDFFEAMQNENTLNVARSLECFYHSCFEKDENSREFIPRHFSNDSINQLENSNLFVDFIFCLGNLNEYVIHQKIFCILILIFDQVHESINHFISLGGINVILPFMSRQQYPDLLQYVFTILYYFSMHSQAHAALFNDDFLNRFLDSVDILNTTFIIDLANSAVKLLQQLVIALNVSNRSIPKKLIQSTLTIFEGSQLVLKKNRIDIETVLYIQRTSIRCFIPMCCEQLFIKKVLPIFIQQMFQLHVKNFIEMTKVIALSYNIENGSPFYRILLAYLPLFKSEKFVEMLSSDVINEVKCAVLELINQLFVFNECAIMIAKNAKLFIPLSRLIVDGSFELKIAVLKVINAWLTCTSHDKDTEDIVNPNFLLSIIPLLQSSDKLLKSSTEDSLRRIRLLGYRNKEIVDIIEKVYNGEFED